MNVFFTTPYAGKKQYQAYIDAAVTEIAKDNRLITPENTQTYMASVGELQKQGLNKNQAHYAFIRQGIASADAVIIEATEEDIRVGHELTLALLFHKPTLVLAQGKNFGDYITHDLLQGANYKTTAQMRKLISQFLMTAQAGRAEASMQTLDTSADSLHSMALAKLRQLAKQEPGQFGQWARDAEKDPTKVAADIDTRLGRIQKQAAWSVFAPVYNEDSPDYIQGGVAKFVREVVMKHGISQSAPIVEAACGTAALARQLGAQGFTDIKAFDNSRPMLAEAFKLSANYPAIELFEADITSLNLPKRVPVIVWTDYSSNFALNSTQLEAMLIQLLDNLLSGGLLIFDIRTFQGWQIDFYSQPVTTFATEHFQRIWLNHQDRVKRLITFDVFIRTRDADGAWGNWQRESMTERMWRLSEVLKVLKKLPAITYTIYQDDFRKVDKQTEEPNLAYLVLQKK